MNKILKASIYLILFVLSLHLTGLEKFSEGEKLYRNRCGRCHNLYDPGMYKKSEWKIVVDKMAARSGLSENESEKIAGYLASKSGSETSGIRKTVKIGGYLYTEYFSSPAMTNSFDIHYLAINIDGTISKSISFHSEFEFEHGGGKLEPAFVEEAYINLKLNRSSGVKIGAVLSPFNRFDEFHSPLENSLITRPQLSREVGASAWKDVGVILYGTARINSNLLLNYDLYVTNGLGSGSRIRKSRQYRDNNSEMSKGLRTSLVIGNQVETGFSFYKGSWDDSGELNLTMYGFFLKGSIAGTDYYAEYAKASSENGFPFPDGIGEGYFIQLSRLIESKIRLTGRFGTLDYFDPSDILGRTPTDIHTRVLAIGLNYYPVPSVVLKAEYDFVIERPGIEKKDNNIIAFQAALRF